MKTKNRYYLPMLALALGVAACTTDTLTDEVPAPEPPAAIVNDSRGAIPGQVLVKFRPEVSRMLDKAQATRSTGTAGCITRSGMPSVDEVLDIIGTYELERVFPTDLRNEERSRQAGLHLWYTVRFDEDADLDRAAADLAKLGEVAKIEFDREIRRNYTAKARPVTVRSEAVAAGEQPFNDPQLPKQWHYINDGSMFDMEAGADVGCLGAWKKCKGDPSVIVAVMDEGVDWSHPDLQANMWVNEGEIYGSNEDNDGNGYAGDRYGYNFSRSSGHITVDNADTGHGTHVAGTIAAVNGNGEGVCGIAGGDGTPGSGVKIMSIQIYSGSYGCTVPNQARGIKYAADNGAVILQCSWGYMSGFADQLVYRPGPKTDEQYMSAVPLLQEALDYFIHNAGSPDGVIDGGLTIFASGNEGAPGACYPGAYGDNISVAAMTGDYAPTSYSNYDYRVDITAPGGDADRYGSEEGSVLSTMPKNIIPEGYGYMDGTSMACPHVSGVAALGLSYAAKQHKHFRAKDYRELLLRSVEPIDPHLNGLRRFFYRGSLGAEHSMLVDISTFRGKMGTGIANAEILLGNIDNEGVKLVLPNAYVAVGAERKIDPTHCFDGGETASFTVSVEDATVASVRVEGQSIVVEGLKVGRTAFSVTASTGETQMAVATVRKRTNDNGWF